MQIESFIQLLTPIEEYADAPLDERRRLYEALHAKYRPADPAGMQVNDDIVAGVAVRRFLPAQLIGERVVYVHGGGWNLGSAKSHHGITADLAERLEREVVSVDYRLLPEVRYSEALDDCRAVVEALDPVAVIGDSAGGRLALDIAGTRQWSGILGLIYPVVETPTPETLGEDGPLLSRADILALWEMAANDVPKLDPHTPPAMRIEALAVEHDPLTRPLEQAIERWRSAGASVGYRCAPNMVHSALHGHAELPDMAAAWQDFCQALRARLNDT
ncbi:alpha/beta hydrolase fold domain-containing protein [Chromohalobacter sarecensis]|uniref:Alpha/beta hydrolase fold domain-containing protein n=1 Tax=Chromohalobacter sarecensis TaxID=245294 RepID=A0ABV9CZW1_9GAMM|nr:alpha/beta hydrolase fold domain-containing protein [Chromohalobacter sarecensis]MCK0713836.1 alpha/beta hydrolase [Chromohalobacter sarecensis]